MSDSREQGEERLLIQALRQAYAQAPGCPAPEIFLEEDTLEAAERERLAAHVSACAACAAERELAQGFATAVEASIEPAALESPLSRLREQRKSTARSGASGPAATRARRRWFGSASLPVPFALAASVLLAAVLVVGTRHQSLAPELPTFNPGVVMRGARVEVLAPEGLLSDVPEAFRWRELDQAQSYRISVLAVDDSVLWSAAAPTSPLTLSAELREQLHPAVRYRWQVEAIGPSGPMATSALVDFRIDPRSDRD